MAVKALARSRRTIQAKVDVNRAGLGGGPKSGREQFAPGHCGNWLGGDYSLPAEWAEAGRARRVVCVGVSEQADPFEREGAAVHG